MLSTYMLGISNLSELCQFGVVEVDFMWFWLFMLICDMIISIVMVIGGRMMRKHCPKHINGMSGYRTTHSISS